MAYKTIGRQNAQVSSLKVANYQVLANDYIIGIGTLTGTITITLPANPNIGDTYIIKDVNGTVCATTGSGTTTNGYIVIIDPGSGITIDAFTHTYFLLMDVPYQGIMLVASSNKNWMI